MNDVGRKVDDGILAERMTRERVGNWKTMDVLQGNVATSLITDTAGSECVRKQS